MHTMRKQLNDDDLFFQILKNALTSFEKQNITTVQLVQHFDDQTDADMAALFDIYLKYAEPPKLQYQFDSIQNQVSYKWSEPLNASFPLRVDMEVDSILTSLFPTTEFQSIAVTAKPSFDIADFGYVLIEEIGVD